MFGVLRGKIDSFFHPLLKDFKKIFANFMIILVVHKFKVVDIQKII